jgi:hypothetical protein
VERYSFLLNLRPETVDAQSIRALTPRGFLLSPAYSTKSTRRLAGEIRVSGFRLMADNGNFSLIQSIRGRFARRAEALWLETIKLEERLGRSATAAELPRRLLAAYGRLAKDVRRAAEAACGSGDIRLEDQLVLEPDNLIGLENIAMAAWLSLNIEPERVPLGRASYRAINRGVARRAAARRIELLPRFSGGYYPVASALSYNTAFDAGKEFAAAGHERIALGFGAFMADDNWTDRVQIGRRVVGLGGRLPNRYVRTAAVARGMWDGYLEARGHAPRAFHFLGLGAPIMIPLLALAGWATPELTFDATSPIKDALQGGTLYVTKPALLKVRTRKVAFRLTQDPTAQWDCPCPFCREFSRKHPFRREVGFKWAKSKRALDVEVKDLRPGGALFRAFPLMSEPAAGPLREAVDRARIGHNHWVLKEVFDKLRRTSSKRELDSYVRRVIQKYTANSGTAAYASAVMAGYQIVRGTL